MTLQSTTVCSLLALTGAVALYSGYRVRYPSPGQHQAMSGVCAISSSVFLFVLLFNGTEQTGESYW